MSELSVLMPVERIGRGGTEHLVEADAAARVAIARRLRILDVLSLACRFSLRRAGPRVEATGALRARVVQECVVSLEPVESEVADTFELRFVPAGEESEDQDDPLSVDELPIEHGAIDLGEAAVQQLALALDPYPRRSDATLPGAAEAAPENPFAILTKRAH